MYGAGQHRILAYENFIFACEACLAGAAAESKTGAFDDHDCNVTQSKEERLRWPLLQLLSKPGHTHSLSHFR